MFGTVMFASVACESFVACCACLVSISTCSRMWSGMGML